MRLNWIPTFSKQPWSNTRGTLCAIWENNLETFEKLFSITQSSCSIYSLFLKPLHWNIHELWEQALIVMKITSDFEKIVKASCFLHLTSVNWSVLKIRLCFDKWCRVYLRKIQNSQDDNLCKKTCASGYLPKITVD